VIARQALTTTVCDKLLNAKSTRWEGFNLSGFLGNLRLPWTQSLSWNFSLYSIYFSHSGCLSNLCLPWIHCIECIFILQNFEQLGLALKNRVSLKIFTTLNIVYRFRISEQFALALKNRVCPELTVLNLNVYILSFRISNNLRLSCKTEFSLKFFTAWKYFLSFRIFEQLELGLKTEFALNFSSRGSAAPLSRTPLANMEKLLLDLAANQLKWQHCWPQSYAFCDVTVQKELNKILWIQTGCLAGLKPMQLYWTWGPRAMVFR